MKSITNRLHLIGVGYHTVAIIPDKDPIEAIRKYLVKTGFTEIWAYLFSYLMTNAIEIKTNTSISGKCYFIIADTKTIGDGILSISSQQVTSCTNIFDRVDPNDIDNPLFIKPTIEEARNCAGFRNTPEHKLRKFCT